MRKALVLQHIEIEPPALIADVLKQKDFLLEYCHGYQGQSVPKDISGYEALIVMGGPMGVYESGKYPFLQHEMKLMENTLKQKKPILGVCLGSQLLAHVLGAEVYPGPKKEIGWHPVELYPEAREDDLWKNAPSSLMGFHWHGDVFDLPKGATALTRSDLTRVQAYRYDQNVYGFLFHMEVNHAIITQWVNGFSEELKNAKIDGQAIIQKSSAYLQDLQSLGRKIFSAWADKC